MKWSTIAVVLLLELTPVFVQEFTVSERNKILQEKHGCRCVLHYQCDKNNNVITSGTTIIRTRGFRDSFSKIPCEEENGIFMVCCKLNFPPLPPQPTARSIENETCGTDLVTNISGRIKSNDLDPNPINYEFPWTVVILKNTSGNYERRCGGSLIHRQVVLTANHCVFRGKPGDFIVVSNPKIRLTTDDAGRKRTISKIIGHPNYYGHPRYFNDVALLILKEEYSIGTASGINTLCLPPNKVDLEGIKCVVAGWGEERGDIMKRTEVPLVNHTHCQTLLRNARSDEDFELHESFMCAGGQEGRDACSGDGGNPLMCPMQSNDGRYFQAGIVSWGVGCGKKDVPGVYSNVSGFADWIRNQIEGHIF